MVEAPRRTVTSSRVRTVSLAIERKDSVNSR